MEKHDAQEFSDSLGQIGEGWYRQVALGVKLGVPKALGISREDWCGKFKVTMRSPERLEAVQELKNDGHSNRAIADVLGVDPETVNRDMRAANAASEEDEQEGFNDVSDANAAFAPNKISETNHWAAARNMADMLETVDYKIERAAEIGRSSI
jgi:hypothetical protein